MGVLGGGGVGSLGGGGVGSLGVGGLGGVGVRCFSMVTGGGEGGAGKRKSRDHTVCLPDLAISDNK